MSDGNILKQWLLIFKNHRDENYVYLGDGGGGETFCPTYGATCPFGDIPFKLELYQIIYTHSNWNWHMRSTDRVLSWHKE